MAHSAGKIVKKVLGAEKGSKFFGYAFPIES